jgi:hypothetical protein
MPQLTIDLHVAHVIADAVKRLLDRIGRYRLEGVEKGGDQQRELTSVYGEIRHIRDHLRRRTEAHQGVVEVDLSTREGDLTASALLFEIAALSRHIRLGKGRRQGDQDLDVSLASAKRYAIEFASRTVDRLIPGIPTEELRHCQEVQHVLKEIRAKLDPSHNEILHDTAGAHWSGAPDVAAENADDRVLEPLELEFDNGEEAIQDWPIERVCNPRLRAVATAERDALRRCLAANSGPDFRTATVHLALLYQTFVIDAGLRVAERLGLPGDPERWDFGQVLVHVIGRELADTEHSIAGYLANVHELLRPAVQLRRPFVSNMKTFGRCDAFVRKIVGEIGDARPRRPEGGPQARRSGPGSVVRRPRTGL